MIAHAKSSGMKFYGLGVNIGDKRYGASLEAMDICDSKWLWDGKECVEIADGDIERDKIHV